MASIWTVAPESVTKELIYVEPDGSTYPFWVKLKKRLTIGEQRRVQTAGWKGISTGPRSRGAEGEQEISIDWKLMGFARTVEYLLDWSLADDARTKLPLTRETLESLNEDVYDLIDGAVKEHVEAMAEEKKVQSSSSAPSGT